MEYIYDTKHRTMNRIATNCTISCLVVAGLLLVSCLKKENKSIENAIDPESEVITPALSDDELLTLVQRQTFAYFWDFAHPVSGMALERSNKDAYGVPGYEVVTSGGSGFGVMALLVGVERNFITRSQAIERLHTITDFLLNGDRFHGAFPHWYFGSTGKVRPFFTEDNGGDIVETSFMIQGLLTARQYFNNDTPEENLLRNKINQLWNEVEWDWYTNGNDVLTWHWSPEYEWTINHQLKGYNEALITYVLAASSTSHPIAGSEYPSGCHAEDPLLNDEYGTGG